MSLKDFMIEGEEILIKAGDLYATNKRVIKYSKSIIWEEFGDLAYNHITSLKLVNKPTWGLIKSGLLMAIVGGLGWYFNAEIARILGTNWQGEYIYIAYALTGLGILFMILGFIFRQTYYQLLAARINPKDWQTKRPYSKDVARFARVVREHLNN